MKKAKISLYILTILALAAVAWLVFEFAPMAQETPPVILPTVAPEQSDNSDSNSGDDGTLQELEVTRTNVKTVIASLTRADSYHRTLSAESFWENGSSTSHTEVWVRGDSVRMVVNSDKATENILITEGNLYIWNEGSNEVYVGAADSRDADEYQRFVTYEDILDIPDRLISEAGYVDYNGSRCIYAVYTDELLGYKHRVYVSVSTGLVMGDETFDGEILIFNQTSSEPEIITPEDEVFEKPAL